jgi:hypothetical protein
MVTATNALTLCKFDRKIVARNKVPNVYWDFLYSLLFLKKLSVFLLFEQA